MADFIDGAVMLGDAVVALFFLRFWRRTRDDLHGAFALAFALLAALRVLHVVLRVPNEHAHYLVVVRMIAYLVILAAIVRKNRAGGGERR
jgi:hypothetical protein